MKSMETNKAFQNQAESSKTIPGGPFPSQTEQKPETNLLQVKLAIFSEWCMLDYGNIYIKILSFYLFNIFIYSLWPPSLGIIVLIGPETGPALKRYCNNE